MGRRIISPEALETIKGQDTLEGAAIGVQRIDGFWDRVIKNIPGDVVAGWTAILGLFGVSPGAVSSDGRTTNILWIMWAALAIVTFFWTFRQTKAPGLQPAWTQIFISTFAFIVWALALGVPFNTLSFYDSRVSAALLIVFTLAVGAVQPKE
ncbi:MAG: hypothetical protein KA586_02620 [Candidatus Promineofilum sp.]|nr:hypothetical protein [Promineifilum sp.]